MIKKTLGIYVHIPFCIKKCLYCDFLSAPAAEDEHSRYVKALLQEIGSYAQVGRDYLVDTVFFGGGTPSIISPSLIGKIMDRLHEVFEFSPDAEVTIECNPGTLDDRKLRSYAGMGFNRLSMGLQSVNESELSALGRIHSYADFEKNFKAARKVSFANINVDLMFGIPGQTLESWKHTVETAVALGPEHISAYSLIIEEGTPFYEKYADAGENSDLPDENTERGMYYYARDYLGHMGYAQYEISNFARDGRRSSHNIKYWTMQEYLGLGLGAASYFYGRRYSNSRFHAVYSNNAARSCDMLLSAPGQSEKEEMEEFMFLGLRMTDGIVKEDFTERFSRRFEKIYGTTVFKLKRLGLLGETDDRVFLTPEGVDVSNRVLAEFLLQERT